MALLRERGSTALLNAALQLVPIIQMLALLEALPHSQHGTAGQGGSRSAASSSGEDSAASSSSSSGGGGGGDGGSSGPGGGLRPNLATAKVLLERLPHSEAHWELDAALDRLLAAGLEPHYRVFLPWATLHATVSRGIWGGEARVACHGSGAAVPPLPACGQRSACARRATLRRSTTPPRLQAGRVPAVRKVMERVRRHTGKVAPHYYAQLIRVREPAGGRCWRSRVGRAGGWGAAAPGLHASSCEEAEQEGWM